MIIWVEIAAVAFGSFTMTEKNRPLDCARGDKVGLGVERLRFRLKCPAQNTIDDLQFAN